MRNRLFEQLYFYAFISMCTFIFIVSDELYSAEQPYVEGVAEVSIMDDKGKHTTNFSSGDQVLLSLKHTKGPEKVEITIMNYLGKKVVDKELMSALVNADSTYSYNYYLDSLELPDDDWYYILIDSKKLKLVIGANFSIGNPAVAHSIRTFSDDLYTNETNQYVIGDIVYVEVVGDFNPKNLGKFKVQGRESLLNFWGKKTLNKLPINNLVNNNEVYRFQIDLGGKGASKFVDSWWYYIDAEIKLDNKVVFVGSSQIKIDFTSPKKGKKWVQTNWREIK